jgi:aldose 1-epimerase
MGTRESLVFVRFELRSEHLDEGYPGTVDAVAEYQLTETNEIGMHFTAVSDLNTPINMCNHVYWNLSGLKRDIRDHELSVNADSFVEVDQVTQIPTGRCVAATGTPFDFLAMKPIGRDLDSVTGGEQVGYDHSFVIRRNSGDEAADLAVAAVLCDPTSKREMHVSVPIMQSVLSRALFSLCSCRFTPTNRACIYTQAIS